MTTDSNFSPSALFDSYFDGVDKAQLKQEHADKVNGTLSAIGALRESHTDDRARIAGDPDWNEAAKTSRIKALSLGRT